MEHIEIRRSKESELLEILKLQKTAYKKEAERYGDYRIPPLVQTINDITDEFSSSLFLSARHGDKVIGSVRGKLNDTVYEIGRLIVHPDFQRRGIGRSLLKTIEQELPEKYSGGVKFELFTGDISFDNIMLYESEGYKKVRYGAFNTHNRIVYLAKDI